MVGGERSDHNVVAVPAGEHGGGERNGGRGITRCRFGEDVFRRHLGHLLLHGVHMPFAGADAHMVHAGDGGEAVEGGLNQRAPRPEQVEQELRFGLAAQRPQARPGAARGNDGVEIVESVTHALILSARAHSAPSCCPNATRRFVKSSNSATLYFLCTKHVPL